MSSLISEHANRGSAETITVAYFNEAGDAMTPLTAFYSLVDSAGVVINGRTNVEIASPGETNDIVLTALDLANDGLIAVVRILTFRGTYDSDKGNGQVVTGQVKFLVNPLIGLTGMLP